ncbi:MAG: hypothetical protein LBU91_02400, partial [Bacteroidales bacterium]|nr:hypothetical protein [Bacteroidales bacterium]
MKTQIVDWFASLGWLDFVDVLLVIVLLYEGYKLVKGTGADKVFAGLLGIYILYRVVAYFKMTLTASILGGVVNIGAIAIFIIFQPEIRRFLQLFGSRSFLDRDEFSFFRHFV